MPRDKTNGTVSVCGKGFFLHREKSCGEGSFQREEAGLGRSLSVGTENYSLSPISPVNAVLCPAFTPSGAKMGAPWGSGRSEAGGQCSWEQHPALFAIVYCNCREKGL